jgi:hypothetical protein
MTYKEYVTQFIGRKGDLSSGDGNPAFVIGGPADGDVLTDVNDDFVIIKGYHEYAIPLEIFMVTLYKS